MGDRMSPVCQSQTKGTALLSPHWHMVCPTNLAPAAFHMAPERRGRGRIGQKGNDPCDNWDVREGERDKKEDHFLRRTCVRPLHQAKRKCHLNCINWGPSGMEEKQ